jgi:hypothetical protein
MAAPNDEFVVQADGWAFWPTPPFAYAVSPNRLVIALWTPAPGMPGATIAVLETGERVELTSRHPIKAWTPPRRP